MANSSKIENRRTFKLGEATIVIRLEWIGSSFVDFLVTTTAPGRGGLYGGKLRGDVLHANEYSATIAALSLARDYWRGKDHEALASEIDALMIDHFFDCDAQTEHLLKGKP